MNLFAGACHQSYWSHTCSHLAARQTTSCWPKPMHSYICMPKHPCDNHPNAVSVAAAALCSRRSPKTHPTDVQRVVVNCLMRPRCQLKHHWFTDKLSHLYSFSPPQDFLYQPHHCDAPTENLEEEGPPAQACHWGAEWGTPCHTSSAPAPRQHV